jgi:TRAP-type mannitol/chloroaromatic compound transport system permease small subunit
MEKAKSILNTLSESTGHLISYLTIFMVLGTLSIVVLRYAFDLGWIFLQEMIVWMHAAVFMIGAAYTYKQNEHVRVDIFYHDLSPRNKAKIDLAGNFIFLLPLSLSIIYFCWDYAANSWAFKEGSREAGGLPYPFVPLLKSIIPLTAILLILESIKQVLEKISFLKSDP